MQIEGRGVLCRAALAGAIAAGLGMSAPAAADETREAALEQRINELERQLQALMAEVKAQRAPAPVAASAPVPKATAAVGGKPPIQQTTITPGASPNTTFRIGGFVKADFMATRTGDGQLADGAVGRALYLPSQIPVGGDGSGTDYDAHAKFSRFNLGIDSMLDADSDLDALDGIAGYVAWRHLFNPKLRTNLMYARSQYDNDIALTGAGVTRSVQSWRANILYSPYPKLDIGAELMMGQREIESGLDGDLTRLQFTTKYSF